MPMSLFAGSFHEPLTITTCTLQLVVKESFKDDPAPSALLFHNVLQLWYG